MRLTEAWRVQAEKARIYTRAEEKYNGKKISESNRQRIFHAVKEAFERGLFSLPSGRQNFPEDLLAIASVFAQTDRRFNHHTAQQIALRATAYGLHAFAAHTEQLARLCFARYFQHHATI